MGLMLVLTACSPSGGKVAVAFAGKCVSVKGSGVPGFSLSLTRGALPAHVVAVTTRSGGQYETSLSVDNPTNAPAGQMLGAHTEKVVIQISAQGYKSKSFAVTADKIFVGKPNTLNITLESSS